MSPVPLSPVDVPPDEARDLLRRELLQPEYVTEDLRRRALDWFGERFLGSFGDSPDASVYVTAGVALLLVVLLVVIVSRWRRSSGRGAATASSPVLGTRATADELRERARAALARGDHHEAVVDGYRALAVRQVERRRIDDLPGATAHEIGDLLGERHPRHRDEVRRAADHFDLAFYGDRPVGEAEAREVLDLDRTLEGAR